MRAAVVLMIGGAIAIGTGAVGDSGCRDIEEASSHASPAVEDESSALKAATLAVCEAPESARGDEDRRCETPPASEEAGEGETRAPDRVAVAAPEPIICVTGEVSLLDGSPAAGAAVWFGSPGDPDKWGPVTLTDGVGAFRLTDGAPQSRWDWREVAAWLPGWGAAGVEVKATRDPADVAAPLAAHVRVRLTEPRTIRGRVTDERGLPLGNFRVEVSHERVPPGERCCGMSPPRDLAVEVTDADGNFAFLDLPQTTPLRIWATGIAKASRWRAYARVGEGESRADLVASRDEDELVPNPDQAEREILLDTFDAEGRRLYDRVRAREEETGRYVSSDDGPLGTVRVSARRPGTWRIVLCGAGFADTPITLDVPAGYGLLRVPVRLSRGLRVHGRIDAARPLGPIGVKLKFELQEATATGDRGTPARVEADDLAFEGLVPGRWRVTGDVPAHPEWVLVSPRIVTLSPGRDVEVVWRFEPGGDVQVVLDGEEEEFALVLLDAAGKVVPDAFEGWCAEALPVGNYLVVAEREGHAPLRMPVRVEAGKRAEVELKLP